MIAEAKITPVFLIDYVHLCLRLLSVDSFTVQILQHVTVTSTHWWAVPKDAICLFSDKYCWRTFHMFLLILNNIVHILLISFIMWQCHGYNLKKLDYHVVRGPNSVMWWTSHPYFAFVEMDENMLELIRTFRTYWRVRKWEEVSLSFTNFSN